jgi:hypothetical protein
VDEGAIRTLAIDNPLEYVGQGSCQRDGTQHPVGFARHASIPPPKPRIGPEQRGCAEHDFLVRRPSYDAKQALTRRCCGARAGPADRHVGFGRW